MLNINASFINFLINFFFLTAYFFCCILSVLMFVFVLDPIKQYTIFC